MEYFKLNLEIMDAYFSFLIYHKGTNTMSFELQQIISVTNIYHIIKTDSFVVAHKTSHHRGPQARIQKMSKRGAQTV